MVWDRKRRGAALLNGQPAIGLAQEEAIEIRDALTKYHDG